MPVPVTTPGDICAGRPRLSRFSFRMAGTFSTSRGRAFFGPPAPRAGSSSQLPWIQRKADHWLGPAISAAFFAGSKSVPPYLLFVHDGALMGQEMDVTSRSTSRRAVPPLGLRRHRRSLQFWRLLRFGERDSGIQFSRATSMS